MKKYQELYDMCFWKIIKFNKLTPSKKPLKINLG